MFALRAAPRTLLAPRLPMRSSALRTYFTTTITTLAAARSLRPRFLLFQPAARPSPPSLQSQSQSQLQSQQQVRGMKVRSSVKKLCEGCKSVRRKGGKYVYIICDRNPKHKQRQG